MPTRFALIVAIVLAACSNNSLPVVPTAKKPSISATPTDFVPPSSSATIICDAVELAPPPRLHCQDAVMAALVALPADHRAVESIEFHYGSYCPPGARCPPPSGDVAVVILRYVGGAADFVTATAGADGTVATTGPEVYPRVDISPSPTS